MSYMMQGIKQIDNQELKDMLKQKDKETLVIDVREPEEFDAGHIPGVSLLPMHQIPGMIQGFEADREYVFICRSGNRSQNVAMYLKQQGLDRITNVEGGMMFWDGDVKGGVENVIEAPDQLKQTINQK